jgi:nucleoside 2-deoxyribosyltransferase
MAPVPTTAPSRALCFTIGPYGGEESEVRKWSNFLLEKILAPVMKDELVVQRTIDYPESGRIWQRIERDLRDARVVVADLTDTNPNAYFELGFRHALKRPVVHIARAGTTLPFDVRDLSVIFVNADYVDRKGYFTIEDGELRRVQSLVRLHLDTLSGDEPTDPVSAKVYAWQVFYTPHLHVDWLAAQRERFREEVERYEGGGGTAAVSDASLSLFAEYLALKSAASQNGEGTIFLTMNNHTKRLDFGYAAFRFAMSPEPVLIKVVDVTCGRDGLQAIRFAQQSRPYQVERGGRMVAVTIPGYNYTLQVQPDPAADGTTLGTITHPHSQTTLGMVELAPRYGEYLR